MTHFLWDLTYFSDVLIIPLKMGIDKKRNKPKLHLMSLHVGMSDVCSLRLLYATRVCGLLYWGRGGANLVNNEKPGLLW